MNGAASLFPAAEAPATMKAISVRQPWAWLLFHGKGVENRDWYTAYRGALAIHASAQMPRQEYSDAVEFVRRFDAELAARIPAPAELAFGAVLGLVIQTGCVRESASPWFCGKFGHIYSSPRLLARPVPAIGKLSLWDWRPPAEELAYAE
jgi:hypothetical protein